jgi:hypothetical protein
MYIYHQRARRGISLRLLGERFHGKQLGQFLPGYFPVEPAAVSAVGTGNGKFNLLPVVFALKQAFLPV